MNGKVWYLSKTLWVNILVVVIAILGFVAGDQFPIQLGPDAIYYIGFALGILNIVLRFLTGQPVSMTKK